jgi:NitT/TauT family transport system permease protein
VASKRRKLEAWSPWIVLAAILLAWEAICRGFQISDFIFPAPTAIVQSLVQYAGPIAGHAMQTFWSTMAGFALGVVVGLLLGVIVGSSRLMYTALYPLMVGFNSIPKSAFVPVLVVWFGIGTVPAILTAFVICFFPITVNMATGLATIEPELEDVLRALGANRMDVLLKVGLPRSRSWARWCRRPSRRTTASATS